MLRSLCLIFGMCLGGAFGVAGEVPTAAAGATRITLKPHLEPVDILEHINTIRQFYRTQSWEQGWRACDQILQHSGFQLLPQVVAPKQEMEAENRKVLEKIAQESAQQQASLDEKNRKILAGLTREKIRRQRELYAESRKALEKLPHDRITRQQQREEVRYYRAMCKFESIRRSDAADKPAKLLHVIQAFKDLVENRRPAAATKDNPAPSSVRRYDRPRLTNLSRYWLARARLAAGQIDAALADFRNLTGLNTNPEIEVNAGIAMVDALKQKAEHKDTPASKKKKYLEEAITELTKVGRELPERGTEGVSPDIQHQLVDKKIDLLMKLNDYDEAEKVAQVHLRKRNIPAKYRASIARRYASCAFEQANFSTAAKRHDVVLRIKNAATRVRVRSFLELGKSLAHLLDAARPDERAQYLTRAQGAFEQAIKLMPPAKQPPTIYALARIFVSAGEYQEAINRLAPLIKDNAHWRIRATALAAVAAQGLGNNRLAIDDFTSVTELPGIVDQPDVLLRALKALVQLERSRRHFASSLIRSQTMLAHARKRRMQAEVAEALMGIALARIGLAESQMPAQANDEWMIQVSMNQYRRTRDNSVRSQPTTSTVTSEPTARRRAFMKQVEQIRQIPSATHLTKALRGLTLLEQRYQGRIRMDELRFANGRAQYLLAQTKARLPGDELPANLDALKNYFAAVMKTYDTTAEHLRRAAKANPIGSFAPRINVLLGGVYLSQAHLAARVAEKMRQGNHEDDASIHREKRNRYLRKSVRPLQRSARVADAAPEIRAAARLRLGQAYLQLQEYETAQEEFSHVANDPRTTDAMRIIATRLWARALAQTRQVDTAIRKLQPYANRDIQTAIQVGHLLKSAGRANEAHRAYLAGYAVWEKNSTPEKMPPQGTNALAAEALFSAHSFALDAMPVTEISSNPARFLQSPPVAALLSIPHDFPQAEWASRALLRVEQALAKANVTTERVRLAEDFLKQKDLTRSTRQTLYLMHGRALLAASQPEKAITIFAKAREPIRNARQQLRETIFTRQRRALAVVEQGRAAEAMHRKNPKRDYEEQALTYYAYVYASLNQQFVPSDAARLAAADICIRRALKKDITTETAQNHLIRARSILKGGHDPAKMRLGRRRIKTAQKKLSK